jgi:hypothetical protein
VDSSSEHFMHFMHPCAGGMQVVEGTPPYPSILGYMGYLLLLLTTTRPRARVRVLVVMHLMHLMHLCSCTSTGAGGGGDPSIPLYTRVYGVPTDYYLLLTAGAHVVCSCCARVLMHFMLFVHVCRWWSTLLHTPVQRGIRVPGRWY